MGSVFRGSEALARGELTRAQLRWNYQRIHRDIYVPKGSPWSLRHSIQAAWLWSDRAGVIAGRAAAALHGARWVDESVPVEIIGPFNHPPSGVILRRERIRAEDVEEVAGLRVTSPLRTAFDLGRHLPRSKAVMHLDALSAATGLTAPEVAVLFDRYRGARGVRGCREALSLMDSGAQSPKESWLRLLLIDAGLPRPDTQIEVRDANGAFLAYLDMGWEEPMVAVEYDGDQHRTDRLQYVRDIRRWDAVGDRGWHVIRVVKEDRPRRVVTRVWDALVARGFGPSRLPPRL